MSAMADSLAPHLMRGLAVPRPWARQETAGQPHVTALSAQTVAPGCALHRRGGGRGGWGPEAAVAVRSELTGYGQETPPPARHQLGPALRHLLDIPLGHVPSAEPFEFAVEWPFGGIELTIIELDGAAIVAAAGQSAPYW